MVIGGLPCSSTALAVGTDTDEDLTDLGTKARLSMAEKVFYTRQDVNEKCPMREIQSGPESPVHAKGSAN